MLKSRGWYSFGSKFTSALRSSRKSQLLAPEKKAVSFKL